MRKEPEPPPVLTMFTSTETAHADRIVKILAQALRETQVDQDGARARLTQFLNALVNPNGTTVRFIDHDGNLRSYDAFNVRVANRRVAAFRVLADGGLSMQKIGRLVGLKPSAVQAVFERADGVRAGQVRIPLKDKELLARAREAAKEQARAEQQPLLPQPPQHGRRAAGS